MTLTPTSSLSRSLFHTFSLSLSLSRTIFEIRSSHHLAVANLFALSISIHSCHEPSDTHLQRSTDKRLSLICTLAHYGTQTLHNQRVWLGALAPFSSAQTHTRANSCRLDLSFSLSLTHTHTNTLHTHTRSRHKRHKRQHNC